MTHHSPEVRRRTWWTIALAIATAVIVAVMVGILIWRVGSLSASLDQENRAHNDDNQSAQQERSRAQEQYKKLYEQYVEKTGEKPASVPTPGAAGRAGATGNTGSNGKDATDAQVSAQVQAYCDAHSGCKGADGSSPSVEQIAGMIAAAHNAFCADGACKGAAGPPGKDGADSTVPGSAGADGKDGVSVQSMSCDGSHWTVTLSNGTAIATNGTCSTEPATPGPTDTPAPPG